MGDIEAQGFATYHEEDIGLGAGATAREQLS
jgi:hypothetical protein